MATEEPVSPSREEQIQRLLGAYETHLRKTLPTTPQTLEQIERTAQDIGEEVKQEIQKEVADAQGAGVLSLPRLRQGFCPLDRQLQMGSGQCSVTVAALLARFAAYLPFETAARELELVCGIRLSAATLRRQAEAVGEHLAREWQQKEARLWAQPEREASARPRQLHLTCDGVMVHVGGTWREAKIGCAYERAEDKAGVKNATYYATLLPSQPFGKRLRTLGHEAGAENCGKVGFVADGAEWIWQEAGKYYPQRAQILDFYHACQHLGNVASAWHGEGSQQSAEWLETQKEDLLANRAERVLKTIEDWQPTTQSQAEVQRKEGAYLRTHLRRMRYETFAQSGYHIGSGVAEASCKNVVQARFKQAGMRWSESGAEAMLHLRTAWCNTQQADLMQAARGAMGFA
ncbi:uncharacterized protein KY384_000076 [Bacidia gigantensis]|uniref:uncharacterized protein n=1 Tax=Bacidia gigantensis TaxID=2732470 RepID=UPI001D0465AA|nr:uncharacterized protein KY384_000076 [Bacidia gigantensis]KAG8526084.1 hypothetical protein KY384_000076 [Bacidia gigantensis]